MDKKDLRNCFAMFKSLTGANAEDCFKFADDMLEVSERLPQEEGILAIKTKKHRKGDGL
jgi:hypothetical protein